ncbi:MAG: DEAD/DEAH box helicase family protein [Candidatus Omnitrophica bacterium]|nr:DEAD/DEAH box helicase family protein [Candidatus Omnitrophota bacterium]
MSNEEPLAHSAKKEKGIPVQTYAKHISGVISRAEKNVSNMTTYFNGDARLLAETVGAAAAAHDLGKLDEANQKILKLGSKKSLPINHVDAGTASLCSKKNNESAILVYGHHIGLCSVPSEVTRGSLFLRDSEVQKHTDNCLNSYKKTHEQYCGQILEGNTCERTGWSALTRRLLFSCLVDADYGDTAQHYGERECQSKIELRWKERINALDDYVAELAEKNVGHNRNSQRQEVFQSCKGADINPSIYACDSPVGTGKTVAVMAHLLKVAKEKKLRHIFVILPYTNIIKQSVEVYRKATVLHGENPEEVVAELHHQADFSDDELRRYAALWTAPIIVTTAVQFFETLAGDHPARLRKLHELPGSAVFVDEAHAAIPSFFWPQAWKWFEELREAWRCHVVLASGSLPQFWLDDRIADSRENVPSLLDENTHKLVNITEKQRVIYRTLKQCMDITGLIEFIQSKSGPRLVILNTVQSAAVLADKMQKQGLKVMHLSTALAPCDRNRVIKKVKRCLQNKQNKDWVLVATSCVEAGVDFSFTTAFRESCSAASLIQIGGRVNRHAERDVAEVWDFRVNNPMMKDNPQFATSRNVLKKLFEEKYFENKSATTIVTEAMNWELMSSFGDFAQKAEEIKKNEKQNDFPKVAKLCRVIDIDTRLVIISNEIANKIEHYEKVSPIDLIMNSVQIRSFKMNSVHFKTFCLPLHANEELYRWEGDYDGKFLGYMATIIPLLKMDVDGFGIV